MGYFYRYGNVIILLLVLTAFSCNHTMYAQNNKRFYFNHIEENAENNYGRITCITKDLEGFIWYGSYNGIYRYDGYESKPFRYNENDTTTIDNNLISSLFVDSNGTLWAGTFCGINRFNSNSETFKRYKVSGIQEKDFPVLSITECDSGDIWCGSWGKGLLKIDKIKDELTAIDLSEFDGLTRKSNNIKQVKTDKDGNLYICTWGDGLIHYNIKNNSIKQFKHIPGDEKSIPNNYLMNIEAADDGKYFVACKYGVVSEYSEQDNSFRLVENVTSTLQKINTEITKLKLDLRGNICIATYGGGVIIYDPKNKSITKLQKERNNIHSLSSNLVTDVFFTKDDNLTWITTINGINLRAPGIPKFRTFNYLDLPDSLAEFNCQGFIHHINNKICIATRSSGIWEFDPETETFEQFDFLHTPALSSNNILSIAHNNNDDKVFVGTSKGLNIINPKINRVEVYNSSTKIKPSNDVIRSILIGNEGKVWLGTASGLELFNTRSKSFSLYKPYPSMNTLSAKNLVRTICRADDKNLWIGTSTGGLIKFNIKKRQFTERYVHSTNSDVSSISDNKINDIFIDSKKYVWIATGRGLTRFDTKNNSFKKLGRDNGLIDDNIYAVEEDDRGNIWFSTGKSICKLDIETWTFKEYNRYDGVTASGFNNGSSLKLPSGKLLFGGVNGFNLFMPDSIRQNNFLPNIALTDIKILNLSIKEYEKENNRKITNSSVNHIKELKLKSYENSLSFKFAALNYILPQKNQYKHILEGFDKDWINTGNTRTATYTNLPPGRYTFRIKAANNDKVWSPHEKSIVIIITPPFYTTWAFRIILLALFTALIVFYIRMKTIEIRKQKDKLEKVVTEKTRELLLANKYLEEKQEEIETQHVQILSQKNELEKHKENLENIVRRRTRELEQAKLKAEKSEQLKTAFLANMSHEIRTPMNAIVGFSTLLNTPGLTEEEKKEYIGHIKENSDALLVLIDDLLDLSQIEAGNMYIRKEHFLVKDIISQITKIYTRKYGSRKIKLINSFNNTIANTMINSDPNRLKQVLRNLLENAYKFTEKGSIEIGIAKHSENGKDYVLFYVKDSGMGIPEDKLEEIFDRFRKLEMNTEKYYSGVGLGLSISKKIVENLGGRIWAESKEGEFSKFIFIIPLETED